MPDEERVTQGQLDAMRELVTLTTPEHFHILVRAMQYAANNAIHAMAANLSRDLNQAAREIVTEGDVASKQEAAEVAFEAAIYYSRDFAEDAFPKDSDFEGMAEMILEELAKYPVEVH